MAQIIEVGLWLFFKNLECRMRLELWELFTLLSCTIRTHYFYVGTHTGTFFFARYTLTGSWFNSCSLIATRIFLVFLGHFPMIQWFSVDTTIFHVVVTLYFPCTCQDSKAMVRKPFIAKIHKLLKQHAIPSKYACAFAFAASDSLENLRDDVSLVF